MQPNNTKTLVQVKFIQIKKWLFVAIYNSLRLPH